MRITHLSLTNFRNYVHLELDIPQSMVVLQGDNAQGKSNLLEALYLLATTRSPRASRDREFINWSASRDEAPFARIRAEIHRVSRKTRVEIILQGETAPVSPEEEEKSPLLPENPSGGTLHVLKCIRINGVARRAVDLIGQLNVVMFTPQDIDLIGGPPSLRRRYLDITNSQVDSRYLRTLQRYHRVFLQRNHLLRLLREQRARPDELVFWDEQLVEAGSYLMAARQRMVLALNDLITDIHHQLTGAQERLRMVYVASAAPGGEPHQEQVAQLLREALGRVRNREIAQGVSLIGPHRDDLRFLVDDVDMAVYSSRGQQRTIATSLRLAEARFMLAKTGEYPVLLLDDILSELDARRRSYLLDFIRGYEQVLITTTDLDRFEPGFLARAAQFRVEKGGISRQRTQVAES